MKELIQKIRKCKRTLSWKKQILKRDEYNCNVCGAIELLQVHHKQGVAEIIKRYKLKTIADALDCDVLFDLNNGETLCETHHKGEHNER